MTAFNENKYKAALQEEKRLETVISLLKKKKITVQDAVEELQLDEQTICELLTSDTLFIPFEYVRRLSDQQSTAKHIERKILPQYYKDVVAGTKTFELRKDKDNIQVGDILDLCEWDGDYTGRKVRCLVTYVLRNCPEYGLMDGYCVLGIDVCGEIAAVQKK